MVDLIDWGRRSGEGGDREVQLFGSVEELSRYSKRTGKIFRNTLSEDSGGSGVVLRHLLRPLLATAR